VVRPFHHDALDAVGAVVHPGGGAGGIGGHWCEGKPGAAGGDELFELVTALGLRQRP